MWVKLLLAHPKHGAAGKTLQLTEAVAKSLVEDGFAEATEAPADDATQTAVKTITDTVISAVDTRLDARLKAFEESHSKSLSGAITKNFGALIPATAKDPDAEKWFGFKSGAEFFHAVRKADTGHGVDDRLAKAREAETKTIQGMNTTVGADGGWLAPPEFSNQVLEYAFKDAPFSGRCDARTIGGVSLTFNALDEDSRATGSRRGGVRGYWLDEGEDFTKSKPKFRRLTIKPHKLGVFYYATEEEVEDSSGFDLGGKLAQYAGEEIRWMVNEAILTGNGVGKPLGVLNSPALVSVAKEASQAAATLLYQNVKKMYFRMRPECIPRAVWYLNQDVFAQLLDMAWPSAAGTVPVFVNGAAYPSVAGAPYGTLFGRPIEVTEHNETLGTKGDIVFADFSQYLLGTKAGVKSAMSMHVEFKSEQLCWRFSYRVDGQPVQKAPLTPAKGASNTLSSFVALDTRS